MFMKYIKFTGSQQKHVMHTRYQDLTVVDCCIYAIFFLAVRIKGAITNMMVFNL